MKSFPWQSRVLPLTVLVIGLLFAEKAVVLAGEVTSAGPSTRARHADSSEAPPLALPSTSDETASRGAATEPHAAAKPLTASEIQLFQDLRERAATLDAREHRLDQRDELLQAAELKLQAKLDQLTMLQKQLQKASDEKHAQDSENWSGLVRTYEDMKARDAAAIFNVLDVSVLLEVLDRMEERKAAAVLADMSPERARLATQMLAQRRTRLSNDTVKAAVVTDDQHS